VTGKVGTTRVQVINWQIGENSKSRGRKRGITNPGVGSEGRSTFAVRLGDGADDDAEYKRNLW